MGKRERKQQSIKKAFYNYIFLMFAIVLLLSGIAVKACNYTRDKIIVSHAYIHEPIPDMDEGNELAFTYGYTIPKDTWEQSETDNTQKNDLQIFTEQDKLLCHVLEILTIALPFLFVCTGIWITGSIFYSRKLKKPFHLLNLGITHIEQGDLDFSLEYSGRDELGNLCRAFETMRQRVLENNTEMWNMVDERQKLNASVAHDLRTPITVIKGYSEYLIRNLKNNAVSAEKMEEILCYIQNAAERLEAYADSIHHIHMLENLDLEYNAIDLSMLSAEITSSLKLIADNLNKNICVSADLPPRTALISTVAVFRIIENIVQNACYYSKKNISVELALKDGYFEITVIDDGDGFSEKSIQKAFHPYYTEGGKQSHYGMGLAICKILARKHEGDIFLSNTSDKGAKVFVKLKVKTTASSFPFLTEC